LAKRFSKPDGDGAGKIQRANFPADRQAYGGLAGVTDFLRDARTFLSEKQGVVAIEGEVVGRNRRLGREQNQARVAGGLAKGLKVLVTDDLDMVDIVHRRPADSPVLPGESHRLNQVDADPEAGSKAHDGADVPGDFWLIEGDPHAARLGEDGR